MVSMTSPEVPPEILEALYDAGEAYGVRTSVGDRVAIARTLASVPIGTLNAAQVAAALAKRGLGPTPVGYATSVVRRVVASGATQTLQDVLLAYRLHAIDVLSREYGGKTRANEDSLRNNLRTYLTPRTYAEAHTGRGKTDIYIPDLDALIEVKVWTDRRTYDEGVEELRRYIHTSRPASAFMVVFGDRYPLPAIARSYDEPIAEILDLEGLHVPVIVIPFEVDAPSKALRGAKARSSGGRGSTPATKVDRPAPGTAHGSASD